MNSSVKQFFWVALAVAVAGISSLTALSMPPWLVFVSGMLPLVLYHVRLHAASATPAGLQQSTVDTVYYFGFIVTLATLAASVVLIAIYPERLRTDPTAIQRVGLSFGLGLVATGYSLFARIHLMMRSSPIEDESLADQLSRVEQEVSRTVQFVRRTALDFESLSTTVTDNTRLRTEEVLQRLSSSLETASGRSLANYEQAGNVMRVAAEDWSAAMRAALPVDEIKALKASAKSAGNTLDTFQGQIDSLANHSGQLIGVVNQLESTLSKVASASSDTTQGMHALHNALGQVSNMAPVVSAVSSQLEHVAKSTGELDAVMRDAWKPTAHELAEHGRAVQSHVASLSAYAGALADVEKAVRTEIEWRGQISRQLKSLDDIGVSVRDVNQGLSTMASQVLRLGQGLEESNVPAQVNQLQVALRDAGQALDGLTRASGRVAGLLPGGAAHSGADVGASTVPPLDTIRPLLENIVTQVRELNSALSRHETLAPANQSLMMWFRRNRKG